MKFLYLTSLVSSLALNATTAELIPVLRPPNPSSTAGGSSFAVAVSGDARFVTFLSHANNLVTNDSMNPWMDVFLRDLTNSTTTLVSAGATGMGGGNDNSGLPSVSLGGAFVTFESTASNLVPNDTNGFSDVFLRDMNVGLTRIVNAGTNGSVANGASGVPLISRDGRFVVYESSASNLVTLDLNGTRDLFLYDRVLDRNRVVSADDNFTPGLNGPSHSAAITPDARFIAFVKSATNNLLNPPATNYSEIYVRDMQSIEPRLISSGVHSNYTGGPAFGCYNPVISADGHYVVFKANNGSPAATLYRSDLQSTYPEPIAMNAVTQGWAQVSMDGRFVAYQATDGVRVWDGLMASNRLVLANLAGVTGRVCSLPALSADGNRTVFLVASNQTSTVYVHDWSNDTTTPALVKSNGMPVPVNDSVSPLLSDDGRTIVFDSRDALLVSDDANLAYDVFASGVGSGERTLVSARAASLPSGTSPTPSSRWPGSISANGQVEAISTVDLMETDTNRLQDLYARDLRTGAQTFLGQSTNSTSTPSFSADGRYVAYLSGSVDYYAPWVMSQTASVYRRDLLTGEEILIHSPVTLVNYVSLPAISPDGSRVAFEAVSIRPFNSSERNIYFRDLTDGTTNVGSIGIAWNGSPTPGYGSSREPRFSPDGRWLLFRSTAKNLTTNIVSSSDVLYARDLVRGRTLLLATNYHYTLDELSKLSVSADSRFVASIVYSYPIYPIYSRQISVFDLSSETSTMVADSLYARSVSLSGDGRWMAHDKALSAAGPWSIYVTDLVNQTNELISAQMGTGIPAIRSSSHPQISHDGRYIIFASDATNLVAGDLNNARVIFIRDRLRGVTLLASINRAGTGSGNGNSLLPVLAADGRTLLFQSFASDLIADDFNETADVFVLRLGGTDSDRDGMDDDWEVAYFSTLARDGSGDFDVDGSSDAAEHQLGTDPTNAGSVFQVLKLTRDGGLTTKLLWNSMPGLTYRVQFKDDLLASGWSEASQTVTAAGTTAVWTEQGQSPENRFYRVLLVP